jgi:hypothetical protein
MSASSAAGFPSCAADTRGGVHGARAVEHGVDVDALERCGQQADGRQFRGAPADPVPHGEGFDPAFGLRLGVEAAAFGRDGDGGAGEFQVRAGEGGSAISAAALRVSAVPPDLETTMTSASSSAPPSRASARSKPSGSVLSKKMDADGVVGRGERVGDELRSQGGAADAGEQDVAEGLARLAEQLARAQARGEVADLALHRADGLGGCGVGGAVGIAQPVVADGALFVGIGDLARFEPLHGVQGPLDGRVHALEKVVAEAHAADVERQAEIGRGAEPALVAFPELERLGEAVGCHRAGSPPRAIAPPARLVG